MHAEHADRDWAAAPPVARCRQRASVDIECVIDDLGVARKNQRVLRLPRRRPGCIALLHLRWILFLCCGATVSRRSPSRQVAGASFNGAFVSDAVFVNVLELASAASTGTVTGLARCSSGWCCMSAA
jgi:hypothetical protein